MATGNHWVQKEFWKLNNNKITDHHKKIIGIPTVNSNGNLNNENMKNNLTWGNQKNNCLTVLAPCSHPHAHVPMVTFKKIALTAMCNDNGYYWDLCSMLRPTWSHLKNLHSWCEMEIINPWVQQWFWKFINYTHSMCDGDGRSLSQERVLKIDQQKITDHHKKWTGILTVNGS